jgi:hypothetical protein
MAAGVSIAALLDDVAWPDRSITQPTWMASIGQLDPRTFYNVIQDVDQPVGIVRIDGSLQRYHIV